MDTNSQIEQLNKRIIDLQNQLTNLQSEFYRNNFSGRQDFTKASSFTTRLKVPNYTIAPSVAEVGEIIEIGGKLYICSTSNSFTLVGTQT